MHYAPKKKGSSMPIIDISQGIKFNKERPVKKIIVDSENARVALICLSAGQQIEPHSSKSSVLMYAVSGEGKFSVGDKTSVVKAGTLAGCAPNEPHGITAETNLVVMAVITPRP